jgi:lysophospholipase L1-like esterase
MPVLRLGKVVAAGGAAGRHLKHGRSPGGSLSGDQEAALRGRVPRGAGIPRDADLITITAGGNDMRYAGSLLRAA